jgi:hypothetical protein
MKKFVALALFLAAHCVHAEWLAVGEQNGASFYIDLQTATGTGDIRQAWELLDMPEPDVDGVRSLRFKMEYDCKGKRSRGLAMLTFADRMAAGTELSRLGEDPDGWEDVEAGTIFETRLRAACGK